MAMTRAKRHYIPGQIWHITHRCHKREFLLKFSKDRRRWLQWLFEAKRRYGLTILNYIVTSNHIHLLVADDKGRGVIPDSIKLIAGRSGQEFNQRVDSCIENGDKFREEKWTGSIAVGSERFVADIKTMMGGMAAGRRLMEAGETYQLRETQRPYIDHFGAQKCEIDPINAYFWD